MAQRVRILLLIPHLGGGGAEQVSALLARGLSREKYDLHLGLVTQGSIAGAVLSPWVTVHPLGASRVRAGTLGVLRLVRRLRPAAVVSGMAHLNFLVLLLRPFFPHGTRVLVRQNTTVSSGLTHAGLPRYTRLLYRLLYRHADQVICQSRAMAADLADELQLAADRIAVLPNPIDIAGIRAASAKPSRWTGPGPHLLAIGRLSREKGFDLLIDAFAAVRLRFPTADLLIAGAGPEVAALEAQVSKLALDQAICFAGYLREPWSWFPGATLFVLASRYEGMPNALLEAAAAELPLVATPASGGIVELLRDRPDAWLAADISAAALADALLAALNHLHSDRSMTAAWATAPR